jgi:hypothetical protein
MGGAGFLWKLGAGYDRLAGAAAGGAGCAGATLPSWSDRRAAALVLRARSAGFVQPPS